MKADFRHEEREPLVAKDLVRPSKESRGMDLVQAPWLGLQWVLQWVLQWELQWELQWTLQRWEKKSTLEGLVH